MADHDVTLGEVYRRLGEALLELREMRRDLVGRAEYESDQEGIAHRFEESGKVHTSLEAKATAIEAKVDAKLDALELKVEAQEKEQRQTRSKWVFAIVMAVASPVLAFIVNLIARGGT